MAYVILGFGGVFILFWALALIFAFKTDKSERNILIPTFFVVVFGTIVGVGISIFVAHEENVLIEDSYLKLEKGMSVEEAQKLFDGKLVDLTQLDNREKEAFDLTRNRIEIASTVKSKMKSNSYILERTEAKQTVTFKGDPSKVFKKLPRNWKGMMNALGMPAEKGEYGGDGLKGLVIRIFVQDDLQTEIGLENHREEYRKRKKAALKKNKDAPEREKFYAIAKEGKEWVMKEGEDWKYPQDSESENDDGKVVKGPGTAEQAAAAFVEAFNEKHGQFFLAEIDVDEDPAMFTIIPVAEEFLGENSNTLKIQVMTGDNIAVKVGRTTKGDVQRFNGGNDKLQMDYFYEEDAFWDRDFDTSSRLVVAGYINDKLVNAGQRNVLGPETSETPDGKASFERWECEVNTKNKSIPDFQRQIDKSERKIKLKNVHIEEFKADIEEISNKKRMKEEERNQKIDRSNDQIKKAENAILREENKIKEMKKEIKNAKIKCMNYKID